jgi:hypothetical protein
LNSKSEKFMISSFLADVVREKWGRFLKRDGLAMDRGGGWLEAYGDNVRKKAMHAISRMKGDGWNRGWVCNSTKKNKFIALT